MKKLSGILFWVAVAALAVFLVYLIYDQYKPEGLHLFGKSTAAVSLPIAAGTSQRVETSSGDGSGTGQTGEDDGGGEEKHPSPAIELADLEGKTVSLSDFKGKTVFINFWAMGTPLCLKEMSELNNASGIFEERGDAVVITVNKSDTRADIIKYFEANGIKLTVLIDDYGKIFNSYGVNTIPVTFVVDSEGCAHGYIPSATTASALVSIADDLR